MIDRIAELNRVLLAVDDLLGKGKKAEKEAVVRRCRSSVIEGRIPDHEASVEFATQIGLLKRKGKYLALTTDGIWFIDTNSEREYDLNVDQKRFLIRNCYLAGPFREDSREVFLRFRRAYDRGTFGWSRVDDPPIEKEGLLEQLAELGLLTRTIGRYEVSQEFVDAVANFLAEGKGYTEEQMREDMAEKLEVGAIAESLAKKSEVRRLTRQGHKVEAKSVRQVSKLRVNAGYDIESFDGASSGLAYDRFIEVKGARGRKVHFFWTENEMSVAKALRERYWIYFQGGIDTETKSARNGLLAFQDPMVSILNDARFTKTQHGVLVEADLVGGAIEITV